MADFLTATEAARRLGVKPATLYAYVSRGVLSRVRAPDGRGSLFGAEEVERLARRGRPRRASRSTSSAPNKLARPSGALTRLSTPRLTYA